MKSLLLTLALITFVSSSFASTENNFTLVKLSMVSGSGFGTDDTEEGKIELKGCKIKGYFDHCDNYEVHMDGKKLELPEQMIWTIQGLYNRTSFTYFVDSIKDNLTEGISSMCAMGGTGSGSILSVYFHTTPKDSAYTTLKSEMTPILSSSDNCLFVREIKLENSGAQSAAEKLQTILETIYLLKK